MPKPTCAVAVNTANELHYTTHIRKTCSERLLRRGSVPTGEVGFVLTDSVGASNTDASESDRLGLRDECPPEVDCSLTLPVLLRLFRSSALIFSYCAEPKPTMFGLCDGVCGALAEDALPALA